MEPLSSMSRVKNPNRLNGLDLVFVWNLPQGFAFVCLVEGEGVEPRSCFEDVVAALAWNETQREVEPYQVVDHLRVEHSTCFVVQHSTCCLLVQHSICFASLLRLTWEVGPRLVHF